MRAALAAALLSACAPPAPTPGGPFFEDAAPALGLDFDRTPTEGYDDIPGRLGGGVCVLDVDGHPPLDLFFSMRGQSRLYLGGPTYADATVERGLDDVGDALGCLAWDADGDGDDDLLVTGLGTLRLFLANGERFEDATAQLDASVPATHVLSSAAAGDYDGDGDLDIVVAGFIDADSVGGGTCGGIPCALYLSYATPVPNLLLERVEDGFVDVTAARAPALTEAEPTLAIGFVDLDGDGAAEVYVGNDFGARFTDRVLTRGADGLVDVTERLGFGYDAGGNGVDTMGWTVGDLDEDGRFDLATSAFAGFHSPVFLCRDEGEPCEDHGRAIGTNAVRETFRWGNAFFDVDLDGDVDLAEAAGHLYLEPEGEAAGLTLTHAQPPNLLLNDGGQLGRVVPSGSDAVAAPLSGRGIAVVDLDDDGRLDLVIAPSRGRPGVLRNVRATDGHFLRVRLEGRAPNPGGVGALVTVDDGLRARRRQRLAGEGFLGSFDPRVHVGLPTDRRVDVEVRWPSGETSRVTGVAVDTELVVREP